MDEQSQPSLDAPVKKGGLGCGTFMAFVLVLLILVAIGSNEAVGYYLKHCSGENLFDCLLDRVEEPEPQGAVTATGTYSYKDYSVVVTMNIPLEGGSVTGSMSGTCDGSVKGSFSGQNNGVISGKITGACSPFFVNIPASADYSGIVNKDSKTVPVSFTGRGAGLTHKDSMSLSY
ncbi:MAG: hypothetical protein A3A61_03340 [Candidatus Woykebacteria bacterium RIFCSPLOWO2_01_FULL_43_14]|uniref:Uncharacterized protein n=1 Tax=Candidatus Woykebacteria bacterium RIFCSPLOWO2_01_FULL_43_14 TaxID=1802605 RepID=A0A1G1WYJ4_9BACT|nr:MAG: hypothetical protein A3A61_03340 [Candidatus Woykebacteria bacterium RIFCSPLOWO2_01_FULL_43_14]